MIVVETAVAAFEAVVVVVVVVVSVVAVASSVAVAVADSHPPDLLKSKCN